MLYICLCIYIYYICVCTYKPFSSRVLKTCLQLYKYTHTNTNTQTHNAITKHILKTLEDRLGFKMAA